MNIGERIRAYRMGRGLSQRELADRAHVHKNSISIYERGVCEPTLSVALDIAKALEISISQLTEGEDMTYEELQKANATIRTTDVRGKEYAEVPQRVRAFRMLYPEGVIKTQMVSNDGEPGKRVCVFRAEVGYQDERRGYVVLSTGTAYETEGSSNINRTSYIENCETSAVGRALGFLGLGVDVAIASAEEVKQAIAAQDAQKAQTAPKDDRVTAADVKKLDDLLAANGLKMGEVMTYYRVTSAYDLTKTQYDEAVAKALKFAERNRKAREENR